MSGSASHCVTAVVLGAALAVGGAFADEYYAGEVHLTDPYAYATPATATSSAVYLEFHNHDDTDKLVSARTEVAERAEIHDRRHRALAGGLELPTGDYVNLVPGGTHIMLLELKAPLNEGGRFPLTLVLERAGEAVVEVEVRPMPAASPGEYRKGSDHGHGQKMR